MQQDASLKLLLQRTAQGEKDAFRALYRALYSALLRFLFRATGSVPDAEDLLNEVMLVVWRNAACFRGESQVTTWIFGIAARVARRWRQQSQARTRMLVPLELADAVEEDGGDLPLDDWLEQRSLAEGLNQLSADQRETVELAYLFGYSCEEIAALMQCPAGTVKTRLFHARQKLRDFFLPVTLH